MDSIGDRHPQWNHTANRASGTCHHRPLGPVSVGVRGPLHSDCMKRSDCYLWSCNTFKGLLELNQDIWREKNPPGRWNQWMSTDEPRDWISSFSSSAAPSPCTWQWKRDPRQSGAHVVPAIGKKRAVGGRSRWVHDYWKKWCFKFFQGDTILALYLCTSPHTTEQTHFCSMPPSNKNQSLDRHTPLQMVALHVACKHCKAQLSLLTICYSLTSIQNVASASRYQLLFNIPPKWGAG